MLFKFVLLISKIIWDFISFSLIFKLFFFISFFINSVISISLFFDLNLEKKYSVI